MSGNRFTVHNRLAGETDTQPFTKIACGLKFGHIGHDHIGDSQGIHDLVDEPLLGLGDDSITFGCGNDRRQIGAVLFVATYTGNTEAIGQFVNRCALLLVNMVIVEDPIQCIKVLKQCFIGVRITSARDDTGQFADPGICRSPAQGAWIQSVGKVSNCCCVQIALFADGDLVSELSRRAGVGECPVLDVKRDSKPVACDTEFLAGRPVGTQPRTDIKRALSD